MKYEDIKPGQIFGWAVDPNKDPEKHKRRFIKTNVGSFVCLHTGYYSCWYEKDVIVYDNFTRN